MSLAPRPAYTLNQITAGAFFGGPIASTLMMRRNFLVFGEPNREKKTLFYGILISFLIFGIAIVLPRQIPNTTLPIAYTVAFRSLAKYFQMEKSTLRSRELLIASNWRVAGLSLLCFSVMIVAIFAAALLVTLIEQQVMHYQQ